MNSAMHDMRPDEYVPETASFSFSGSDGLLTGSGKLAPVPPGPAATVEQRVAAFVGASGDKGAIGGALPFDRNADDHLWHAEDFRRDTPLRAAPSHQSAACAVRAEPSASDYADAVARSLRIMKDERDLPDGLAKIVLARTLAVTADRPICTAALLARLAQDPAVTAFRVPLPDHAGAQLVGATPELLVGKEGRRVVSHPLAGSARRLADPAADRAAAEALLRSDKDRREHAIVVEYILDTLSPYCTKLGCPEDMQLTSTRSMWHLGTRIEGILRDDSLPAVVLAARLHPTPAVCGLPRDRAAQLIGDLEQVPRGFYAGAVGWCDFSGNGRWYVAIRCATVSGAKARLFAGAGIVPGSDPLAEAAETGAKFGALLSALGLPADAGLPGMTKD